MFVGGGWRTDRRPKRGEGEWMAADKNSSPKRELSLCPNFTTKDSHMSFPRSRSHNGPTNPRRKPQTIPKQKRNSRSKGLSSSARHQADSPRWPGRWSTRHGRTVRGTRMDSPKKLIEPPVAHLEKWTVRALPSDGQWATGAARTVRDIQADGPPNSSRPKTAAKADRNESAQELAKNTKNTWTNCTSRKVRLLSADGPPGTVTARAKPPTQLWISQTA
jgi:hypothetical protein